MQAISLANLEPIRRSTKGKSHALESCRVRQFVAAKAALAYEPSGRLFRYPAGSPRLRRKYRKQPHAKQPTVGGTDAMGRTLTGLANRPHCFVIAKSVNTTAGAQQRLLGVRELRMSTDQLVLLKSRSHRLAEMFVFPIAALLVGPILRALLGNRFNIFYGLAAMVLISVVVTRVSSQWGARHGGEWVTKAERLQRLLAETTDSPWLAALMTTAMLAMTLLGLLLVIDPLDRLGESYGGPIATAFAVTAVSILGGARALFAGYSKKQPVIVDEAPPRRHFWSELRSALPLIYAAYALASVGALVVATQLKGSTQTTVFIVVFLAVSQFILTLRRRAGQRIYPRSSDANLGRQVVAGALLWGIPMGMMFSAGMVLDSMGLPAQMALKVAAALCLSLIGGAALGVLIYIMLRLAEVRRAQ
jgi:hypothetical protein